jgi:hypothetical protein
MIKEIIVGILLEVLLTFLLFSIYPTAVDGASVGIAGQAIAYTNPVVQNTVYQNTNSLTLTIYATWANATKYAQETVWIGNSPVFSTSSFIQIATINPSQVTESLGVLTQTPQILTTTVVVPAFWYFTFNGFGGVYNSFTFEYVNYSGLTGTNGILISNSNSISISTTSPITNTSGTIACASCSSNAYVAGTGLKLTGTTFSLLNPITVDTGVFLAALILTAILTYFYINAPVTNENLPTWEKLFFKYATMISLYIPIGLADYDLSLAVQVQVAMATALWLVGIIIVLMFMFDLIELFLIPRGFFKKFKR